jgi:hypothetical protein
LEVKGSRRKMLKAFVIIRLSTEDQLKGYGADVQWEDDILPNAPTLGLEIDESYRRVIQGRPRVGNEASSRLLSERLYLSITTET